MAESREKENEREHEEDELEEALEEEIDDAKVSKGDAEGLTISERRARRKARRKQKAAAEVAEDDVDEDDASVAKEVRTRSQKEAMAARERQAQARGENIPILGALVSYLRGVSAEMQKVTWPTQEEARRLTIIVLIVTLIFSIFLGAIDIFYGWWFDKGIADTGIFLLVGIPVLLIGGGLSWFYILREQE